MADLLNAIRYTNHLYSSVVEQRGAGLAEEGKRRKWSGGMSRGFEACSAGAQEVAGRASFRGRCCCS